MFSISLLDLFNGFVPESLCQMDHSSSTYQPKERQVESNLSLDLKPNSFTGPCKQLFEAPPSHGLYLRVYPVSSTGEKNKHEYSTSAGSHKNMNIGGQRMRNATSVGSCPINIVS